MHIQNVTDRIKMKSSAEGNVFMENYSVKISEKRRRNVQITASKGLFLLVGILAGRMMRHGCGIVADIAAVPDEMCKCHDPVHKISGSSY